MEYQIYPGIEEKDCLMLRRYRRNLHKYPETGWLTYRTTALAAEILEKPDMKYLREKNVWLLIWRRIRLTAARSKGWRISAGRISRTGCIRNGKSGWEDWEERWLSMTAADRERPLLFDLI